MNLFKKVSIDIKANRGNRKGQFIVVCYRVANYIHYSRNVIVKILGFIFVKMYHWVFIWFLGIEIPEDTIIGVGLQVWHGTALVINHKAIIGDYVLLRHCITIGNKFAGSEVPVIGDYVEIGSHSVIIGNVIIGNNVTIGAGAIVTKSVPKNSVAYGNPAVFKSKN